MIEQLKQLVFCNGFSSYVKPHPSINQIENIFKYNAF